jgi:hypothetical protein
MEQHRNAAAAGTKIDIGSFQCIGPLKGEKQRMPVTTILIIILILALIGVFPSWPHARAWGYGPSGLLGIVLVILLILLLLGRI